MEARHKMMLALLLILLWGGVAAWQWRFTEEPARLPLTNMTGPASLSRQAEGMRSSRRVNLGLLASAGIQREASFTTPRNIFAVPRSDGSLPLSQGPALENQQESVAHEVVAEQVQEESAQYRYLGFLRIGESRQKSDAMAVLRKDDEVMVLKIGDYVDSHVILRAINAESVTLRDTDTRMDKTVLLSEETMEQE
ncbi:MAG: hypothetical protein Nkreftii_001451 [Candidatus Nitrospira kreftii]|uniref:Uncharacterized protein n=1 Tax=Candidatus Nitrospira kreftii TaxID=2652173 RepID=A0A7S8IY52_9BACT|nr:MAG: hypothetical protein Nkreftii_001451 [Candidatus Nitrospira kreftii]